MANQWFRLYAEFSTDPKVQMLSESDQRRLIMLFCFRCNGHVTLQDEEVTFMLRISNDEWQVTKSSFIEKGFINNSNEIQNWDKRQFVSDSSAARVAKHREKKKQSCNVTVTPQNRTDTEQNRTDNKKINKKENPLRKLFPEISEKTFNDFIAHRKNKKALITETAVNGLRREASKASISLETALIETIERGWTGFKAEWYLKDSARGSPNNQHSNRDDFNKQQTEIAKQKLFGSSHQEKDITNEARTL